MSKTLIFGHKNPDTDTICSALVYSDLKNSL
ncbi:DHH family phosphoesterase, partial [Halobacillus sp. BBL2006]